MSCEQRSHKVQLVGDAYITIERPGRVFNKDSGVFEDEILRVILHN